MYNFKNKNVVITGASRGIGESLVMKFSEFEANIFLISRDTTRMKKIVSNIAKKKGQQLSCISLDISKEDNVNNAFEKITKNANIDILINNAGITGPTAKLWDYNIKDWNSIIDINLHGTFYCCKSIVPHMIKNNYGRIVNIASVAGKDGNANASAYSSAKAGVIGLTKSLGKELAKYNIAVNAITPAGAKTRILDQMSKEHVQWMLSKVPRGRFLEINELSSMVCWLSSEENSFSTAAVFDISGGRSTY